MDQTKNINYQRAERSKNREADLSKVILHIGTHKTGTTTIQDVFWENADLLAQHGLVYPRLGKVTGHHALLTDWMWLPPVFVDPRGSRALLADIVTTYAESDQTVFLSSEEFSRSAPDNCVDLAELRQILEPFDEIHVVCVLRTQWEFLQSVYLEISKASCPPAPAVLFSQAIGTGMAQGLWVDYLGLLDRLEAVFDPTEITLIDYKQASSAPGGLLGAILSVTGAGVSVEDLAIVNGGRSNMSPVPMASFIANQLMAPKKAPPELVQMVTASIRQAEKDNPIVSTVFTKAEFEALAEHFSEKNAELVRRRESVQPEFKISEPDASAITHFRGQWITGMWPHLGRQLAQRVRFD